MRQVLNFNTDWQYLDKDDNNMKNIDYNNPEIKEISIPHSNKILPHHYFNHNEYEFISWYRRKFYLDESYKNKNIIIKFDGVMKKAEVFLNGELIDIHKGGYTSFKVDISKHVKIEDKNVLSVRVDSTRKNNIPPEGGKVDYLLFGGIYRRVEMIITEPVYIDWSFFEIKDCCDRHSLIKPKLNIINKTEIKDFSIELNILFDNNLIKKERFDININKYENKINLPEIKINDPKLWFPDSPNLYNFKINILDKKNKVLDDRSYKIGLRKVEFKDDGLFYINNKKIKLRGLNRHQLYPYVGNAMPKKGQIKDAEILKNELGLNFVRSSHYPADPSFLKRCDEIGLLVFEEIPGWQHIGDKEWKNIAIKNLKEMIIRDRNHPSIFIWGVRINESQDDHDFYKKTNDVSKKLDPSRPTGGVRNFQDSEFLEDVFTYNDFEYNLKGEIKKPNKKPYMITEYMGHMFPTKSYDSVTRQIEHALKHAQIQDKQYRSDNIAGASGWCAFDYNTHEDFGSGDRVCYHGVCDMFRFKKMAAYAYESQLSPEIKPVIFIARYLTPSFNEDYGDKILVFSNCDKVKLFVNDKLFKTKYPEIDRFSGLPNPPFIFSDCKWWEWGASTINNLKAEGYINGIKKCEHIIYPFTAPQKIVLTADYNKIVADGADLTAVKARLVDKNDQTLILAHPPVFFDIEGPGEIIGENPLSLEGGRGAVYIKSKRKPGLIQLKAHTQKYESNIVKIESEKLKEKVVPTVK